MTQFTLNFDAPAHGFTDADLDRFWERVNIGAPDECWPWKTHVQDDYPRFRLGHKRYIGGHRFAWMTQNGQIPARHDICHTCDNPRCCNPAHLFAGTRKHNMADCVAKGRQAFGERSGAKKHPERVPRGEMQGSAKLTEAAVREMRRLRTESGLTYKVLGRQFGVCRQQAESICKRQRWQHVTDD